MPFVTCPTCSASLRHEFGDTSVRCENCTADVGIPAFDDRSTPNTDRPRSGFGPTDDPSAWRACRIGLSVVVLGQALCIIAYFALTIVTSVFFGMTPRTTDVLAIVSTVAIVASALVHVAGQVTCCSTPAPLGGTAIYSVVCLGATFVAWAVFVCPIAATIGAGQLTSPSATGLLIAAALVLLPLSTISFSLWIKYLAGVAKKCSADRLAQNFIAYFVLNVAAFLAFAAASYWAAASTAPNQHRAELVNVVFFRAVFPVLSLWYLVTLGGLAITLGRELDRLR